MRVRLSYSVELEDVPESVAQLIEDEAGQLSYCDHAINEINNLLREADPPVESALKKIDKVRQVLGSIDQRLNECESILQGYGSAMNAASSPAPSPPSSPTPPKTYDYNRPYSVPTEHAEDLQFDGEQE